MTRNYSINPSKKIDHEKFEDPRIADYKHFAVGALVGQAVGDALGAPFEFGPSNRYSTSYPQPVLGGIGEMTGGGSFGWDQAEFTDDTQMALIIAESLIQNSLEYNPADIFERFVHWAKTARDVGTTTAATLFSGHNFKDAAALAHAKRKYSAGNGSVMRVCPIGIWGSLKSAQETFDTAFDQARLTHYDPRGAACAGMAAVMIRSGIIGMGITVESMINEVFKVIPNEFVGLADAVLVDYSPDNPGQDFMNDSNGTAWVCLAQAVWSLKVARLTGNGLNNFEVAITSAINLGNDTDTVAAVTGALAGSMLGIQAIPSRWTTYLNGTVDSPFDHQGKRRKTTLNFTYANLQTYARELLGLSDLPLTKMEPPAPVKMLDDDGVYASNLPGMTGADSDMAVLSLCRTAGLLSNFKVRREVFLIDNVWDNLALDVAVNDCVETINAWLAEGRRVVVHCHAGRSRTGFILKAWYMNKTGCSHAEAHEWLENRWSLYDPNGNDLFTRFLDNY